MTFLPRHTLLAMGFFCFIRAPEPGFTSSLWSKTGDSARSLCQCDVEQDMISRSIFHDRLLVQLERTVHMMLWGWPYSSPCFFLTQHTSNQGEQPQRMLQGTCTCAGLLCTELQPWCQHFSLTGVSEGKKIFPCIPCTVLQA